MRLWILGAIDHEMSAIEKLLVAAGEKVAPAMVTGKRIHPGNAYSAVFARGASPIDDEPTHVYLVECDIPRCRDSEGRMHFRRSWSVAGCQFGEDSGGWTTALPGGLGMFDEGDTHIYRVAVPVTVIDHHRKGDPGFGRPPEEYWRASSIGQVWDILTKQRLFSTPRAWHLEEFDGAVAVYRCYRNTEWESEGDGHREPIPADAILTAAADHCLEAAYRGRCPGVKPDELKLFRVRQKAELRQRNLKQCHICGAADGFVNALHGCCNYCATPMPMLVSLEAEILADLEHTRIGLISRWEEQSRPQIVDLRNEKAWPKLPEAACIEGIPYLATMWDKDGREKITLGASPPELVERFLAGEIVSGLTEYYGDPQRGFAGGYIEKATAADRE